MNYDLEVTEVWITPAGNLIIQYSTFDGHRTLTRNVAPCYINREWLPPTDLGVIDVGE